MTFELGVYSFDNTPRLADGRPGPTAQAVRDVLEAINLADEVGLDYFGIGEHHMRAMPLSSPTAVVNAAAASTQRIKLSTAVSVLSTDDPIRVFQQLAAAASIAPGRTRRSPAAAPRPSPSRCSTTTSTTTTCGPAHSPGLRPLVAR
jgi:hypothetical protein